MKSVKQFFATFLDSLNPNAYAHLPVRSVGKAFHYFVSVIIVAFLILTIVGLPGFARVPQEIEKQMEKFSKLEINVQAEMNEPIVLKSATGKNLVAIDTTGEITNRTDEVLLVTKEKMIYQPSVPFAKSREYDMTDLKDLVKNRDKAVFLIWLLIILIMPGILLVSFVAYFLKYLFFVFVAFVVAVLVTKLMKINARPKHILNTALYAATPLIILDIIGTQFFRMYGIPYLAFAFYFIVGIALNAESKPAFEGKNLKKVNE